VRSLLAEVLRIQRAGDNAAANAFVDKWTSWDENLHGVIAKRMRDAEHYRFTLVTFDAYGGAKN
jgi:hypothetical protein